MKITSSILSDFVNDFQLETTDVGVCFDAVINFNLPTQHFNLQSEVHMESVLSKNLDTLYLLNPLISDYKMPTVFNDANHQFLYLERTGLIIAGTLPVYGAYSISLFPKGNSCNPKTLREIRSKKLN